MSNPQPPFPIPAPGVDIDDIQGDVLHGLKKRVEIFRFFSIQDVTQFKSHLKEYVPKITSTREALRQQALIDQHREERKLGKPRKLCETRGVNIAFAAHGLATLGIIDLTQPTIPGVDQLFKDGQLKDSNALGDPGQGAHLLSFIPDWLLPHHPFVPDWLPAYRQEFHGVFIVCAESPMGLDAITHDIDTSFKQSIEILHEVRGNVRPGTQAGHEHFGFQDCISQPALEGWGPTPPSLIAPIDPGVIVVGLPGDPLLTTRPDWAKNGSYMAFRQLKQLVPEFHRFLAKPWYFDAMAEGAPLLGTRFVGRWESGTSADLSPFVDNQDSMDNNFDYKNDPMGIMCPFASHVRKMNPREGLQPRKTAVDPHRIRRSGIPYGPELSDLEKTIGISSQDRGLLFVSYQSALDKGFAFLQKTWANNPAFPKPHAGFDPIIGIHRNDKRIMRGAIANDIGEDLKLPINWVIPEGGEYFFTPSIKALKEIFSH